MTRMNAAVLGLALSSALTPFSTPALAHDGPHAADHAPIGVMADHRHKKGEWMVSYRFMHMKMEGNRDGTDSLAPEDIVTTVANPFAGRPMQPPTLRVMPEDMTMGMHMFGGMYGLSDRITLMAMGHVLTSEMDHITFRGGMGTEELGGFTTETAGFGDTVLAAIIGIDNGENPARQLNVNLGLSLPTGSLTETDEVLTPMNMTPTLRLPYPMQLGSGTYDFRPGVTYRDRVGELTWGAQLSGIVRTGDNDEGYTLGDRAEATAWFGYAPNHWSMGFVRLRGTSQGAITGSDSLIVAPVQTADPANHGGEEVQVLLGLNLAGQEGWMRGHRLAAEIGLPVHRDLNGPQLETDLTVTLGWQKAF